MNANPIIPTGNNTIGTAFLPHLFNLPISTSQPVNQIDLQIAKHKGVGGAKIVHSSRSFVAPAPLPTVGDP
jgi:hypothetical protein